MAERTDQIDGKLSIHWRLAFEVWRNSVWRGLSRYLYALAQVEWNSDMQHLMELLVPWTLSSGLLGSVQLFWISVSSGQKKHMNTNDMIKIYWLEGIILIILTFDHTHPQFKFYCRELPFHPCPAWHSSALHSPHALITISSPWMFLILNMEQPYEWFCMCVHSKNWVGGSLKKDNPGNFNWKLPEMKWGNHPQISENEVSIVYINYLFRGTLICGNSQLITIHPLQEEDAWVAIAVKARGVPLGVPITSTQCNGCKLQPRTGTTHESKTCGTHTAIIKRKRVFVFCCLMLSIFAKRKNIKDLNGAGASN